MALGPTSVVQDEIPPLKIDFSTIEGIKTLWQSYVAINFWAANDTLSDHLANERTWHNWLAASNAVAWMGIVVAQMSRIHCVVTPKHYNMLRKKAAICQAIAIIILLVGSYRFFREQRAIEGKGERASQWSLLAIGLLILGLLSSFFIMLIVADTDLVDSIQSPC